MPTQDPPTLAPRKVALNKETLRRLTRSDLRRAAGEHSGRICPPGYTIDACPSRGCQGGR